MTVQAQPNPRGYLRFRIYWKGRDVIVGTKLRDDGPNGRSTRLVRAKAVLIAEKLEAGAEIWRALQDVLGDCPAHLLPERPGVENLTVGAFAEEWEKRISETRARKSHRLKVRTYLANVILPHWKNVRLADVDMAKVEDFQAKLLARKVHRIIDGEAVEQPIATKTAKNILSGHFAALIRDARRRYRLPERDPFDGLEWPRIEREDPDPFTAEERDRIIDFYRTRRPFWFPWIATLFWTGMRQSESVALKIGDYDAAAATLRIRKSRTEGEENIPKTRGSKRTIQLFPEAAAALRALPARPFAAPSEYLFLNQAGDPIGSKEWPKKSFYPVLARLGIRRRKFYATRHTFATELISRGEDLKAIAEYMGTSVRMLEDDYGRWLPKGGDASVRSLRSLTEARMEDETTGRFAGRPLAMASGESPMSAIRQAGSGSGPTGNRTRTGHSEAGSGTSENSEDSSENPSQSLRVEVGGTPQKGRKGGEITGRRPVGGGSR